MNLNSKKLKLAALSLAMGFGFSAYAKSPADPNKVLNIAYEAPDDGFDTVKTYNFYSGSIAQAIFEPLLKYDYFGAPRSIGSKYSSVDAKNRTRGQSLYL